MRFSLFLGCIAPNRYPGIEAATRKVMAKLGVELVEMEGASCCPAPGAFRSIDTETWLALGARNLTIAEDNKADILTVCNGCFGTLYQIDRRLKNDGEVKERVNEILSNIGKEYRGAQKVRHLVDILYKDIGARRIEENIVASMDGLKVAAHYGCHLLKPSGSGGIDSPERPRFLDRLIEATGAEAVEYKDKTLCCGAGGGVRGSDLDESLIIAMQKLRNVHEAGADLIVNPCSFCTLHYDASQPLIEQRFGERFNIPVLHYAQFLGLAMGLSPEETGLQKHSIPLDEVLRKAGM
jgi:heterodisulfide reductase subunit B